MEKKQIDDSDSDEDNDAFDMKMDMLKSIKHLEEDGEDFKVLSTKDILKYMTEIVDSIMTIIDMPRTTTRMLLDKFKWDREKLTEKFFDSSPEKFFEDVKITNPKKYELKTKAVTPQNADQDCKICYTSYPSNSEYMVGLECGHKYCKDCWVGHLTSRIMDEGESQSIHCPDIDCDLLIDDVTVMRLLSNEQVKVKYEKLITNNFVNCNRNLRWCPAIGCTSAIEVPYYASHDIKCTCGHMFCYECGGDAHKPATCKLLKIWHKGNDTANTQWIQTNAKLCPKCGVPIEKNGGCNHIQCRSCRHDFCWVCLGGWLNHSCNTYNKVSALQEKLQVSIERYNHYNDRYKNHMESLNFEKIIFSTFKKNMQKMQNYNMSQIEIQFLKKAIDILCLCRRTLMYSYIFAYYLKKNNQSLIFEDNQRDLETATEQLSEFLEKEITAENLIRIKQEIQDKYRYCQSRRAALLNHVNEGYGRNWWEFQIEN